MEAGLWLMLLLVFLYLSWCFIYGVYAVSWQACKDIAATYRYWFSC